LRPIADRKDLQSRHGKCLLSIHCWAGKQQTLVMRPHMGQGRPVVRFNTGPLYAVHSDGTKKYDGDVLHMWVPRR